jgi:hypothetical protein
MPRWLDEWVDGWKGEWMDQWMVFKLDILMGGKVNRCLDGYIVVTYAQFDSNIRVLYVFLGFLKK